MYEYKTVRSLINSNSLMVNKNFSVSFWFQSVERLIFPLVSLNLFSRVHSALPHIHSQHSSICAFLYALNWQPFEHDRHRKCTKTNLFLLAGVKTLNIQIQTLSNNFPHRYISLVHTSTHAHKHMCLQQISLNVPVWFRINMSHF